MFTLLFATNAFRSSLQSSRPSQIPLGIGGLIRGRRAVRHEREAALRSRALIRRPALAGRRARLARVLEGVPAEEKVGLAARVGVAALAARALFLAAAAARLGAHLGSLHPRGAAPEAVPTAAPGAAVASHVAGTLRVQTALAGDGTRRRGQLLGFAAEVVVHGHVEGIHLMRCAVVCTLACRVGEALQ